MRRLIWGFTGRTYHIVGNLMSRLNFDISLLKMNYLYHCFVFEGSYELFINASEAQANFYLQTKW